MKNTTENKAKFFDLYWGQEVGRNVNWNYYLTVNENPISKIDFLNLTQPSKITDEDAYALAVFYFRNDPPMWEKSQFILGGKKIAKDFTSKEYVSKSWKTWENMQRRTDEVFSFLRLKGYALPWMGISVEQQIEYGWVKLKNN